MQEDNQWDWDINEVIAACAHLLDSEELAYLKHTAFKQAVREWANPSRLPQAPPVQCREEVPTRQVRRA